VAIDEQAFPECEPCPAGSVTLLIRGREQRVGNFPVARVLPAMARRMVGPFTFLDHMGPVALQPGQGFDVLPHPHIGLSTLTWLLAGDCLHRDSLGTEQVIRPGEVNLMTAGRGVVHSERATPELRRAGGLLHGLQLWVVQPVEDEEGPPAFVHLGREELPRLEREGAELVLVAGEAYGLRSPLVHPSRPLLVDARLAAGARLLTPEVAECAVYVVSGAVQAGEQRLEARTLGLVAAGQRVQLRALGESRVALLGGPATGARFLDWNFASSRRERLEQARSDWRERRFPTIPGDDQEFVPLPERRPR
jgi:redox-sensitive bicupin YhaK (pirin superfamily)